MKHVTEIDNLDNIRVLLTQDFKELGIKIPKEKKIKTKDKPEKTGSAPVNPVFGDELSQVPSIELQLYGSVPKFLVEAVQVLDKNLSVEGIFRKSGSVARQKDLKVHIESGGSLNEANPLDLASLVKQFFRELPDPLLTKRLEDAFIRCHCLADNLPEDGHVGIVLQLCLLLPASHLSTLRFTCAFLHRVAAQSHVNKMDEENLAVCLAPNFLHVGSQVNPSALQAQTVVVASLITHAQDIGLVADSIWERALSIDGGFLSDEEVDGSHDHSHNKKKKRRSGSLQGMITNLSNSFTKWRGKDGKGHNSSQLSERSTLSTMSYLSFTGQEDVNNETAGDEEGADVSMLQRHIYNMDNEATPKVMRKRKAEEETVCFSANKRKAILQGMPQMSALGSTPFTPMNRRPPPCGQADFQNTPSIQFAENSGVVFSATPCIKTPRRKAENLFSPTKSKRQGCFSPKSSTKNGVRRSVRGFLRRLSGGKDPREEDDPADDSRTSADISNTSHKKKGLFRRHKKVPSSPARLVTSLVTPRDPSPACVHLSSSVTSIDYDESYNGPNLSVQSEIIGKQQRHRRGYSAEGLQRGRPNTTKTGLPSPAKRRSMETSSLMHDPFVSPEKSDNPSALDTSPILGDDDVCSDATLSDDNDDMYASEGALCRNVSKSSLTSEDTEIGTMENDHDRAFHESMLSDDEDEGENIGEDGDVGEAEDMEVSTRCSSEGRDGGKLKKDLPHQKSYDSLDSGIVHSSDLYKTESVHSMLSVDSGLGDQANDSGKKIDATASSIDNTEECKENAPCVTEGPESVGSLEADVKQSGSEDDAVQVAARKASPLRFANSTSRRRARMSPVRIPTIFAKADEEAQRYREMGHNVTNRIPSPQLKTCSGASKRVAHLPISTNLVRSVTLDKVRTKLVLDDETHSDEVKTSSQNTAGCTPQRAMRPSQLQPVEINPDNSGPTQGRLGPMKCGPPAIRPSLVASACVTTRLKVAGDQRNHRSPVKPVKRLHVGPRSPARSNTSTLRSPILPENKQSCV